MSNHRRTALLSSSAVLAASLSLAVVPGPASAAGIGNPMAGNLGFNTIVEHDAYFGSTESEGTIAVGGNLSWGQYNVDIHKTATYQPGDDPYPTALLVGGSEDFSASSSTMRLPTQEFVKIGKLTGDVVNESTRGTRIVKSGAGYDSEPRIELNSAVQTKAQISDGRTPIDFTQLFASYRERAVSMDTCATTVRLTNANGDPIDPTDVPQHTNAYITPTAGMTNVLHISGANLNQIDNLTVRPTLDADTPLVIVVDGPASFTWHTPNVNLPDKASLRHVLWDFPATTSLTLPANSPQVQGTIYAPSAAVRDDSSSNIEGDIAAQAYHAASTGQGAGEIHYYPFASDVSCGAVPPTTAPPTTAPPTTPAPTTAPPTTPAPTVSPSTTPAPTSPAPSGSAAPSSTGPGLAETGGSSSTLPLAAGAAAVLAAGALMVVLRLRRTGRH